MSTRLNRALPSPATTPTATSAPIAMAGPWITDHEIKTVLDAMQHGWYEQPYEYCEKFEKEFTAYHSRRFGIMTPNCTTAIHLLLTALGIHDGDEVIVPECTWIATAAPITYLRATPVFADIESTNWCLNPASVEAAITARTKAIIAVDLFGNMPFFDELKNIADKNNIPLIEDAAEALGSTYKGLPAGKHGVASVFSFHRTKTLVTGEGGMLLLDDEGLYKKCRFLRDHGRKEGGAMYYNYAVTYKYMPFNLQAALGYAQLQRIDELVGKKRWILEEYRRRLSDIPDIQLNAEPVGGINRAWITAIVFGPSHNLTKQEAMDRLQSLGIPSRPFFYPLSFLPAYNQEVHFRPRNPKAYDIANRGINLPGALNLTAEHIGRVCDGIHKILA